MRLRLFAFLLAFAMGACATAEPVTRDQSIDETAKAMAELYPDEEAVPACETVEYDANIVFKEYGLKPVHHFQGEDAVRFVRATMADASQPLPAISDVVIWPHAVDPTYYAILAYVDGCAAAAGTLPKNVVDAIINIFFKKA